MSVSKQTLYIKLGALSFGRFMGIFIAMKIPAKRMLIADFIGCTLGGIIIWAFKSSEASLWVGR